MDQTIKTAWVKALRSGEFEQGTESLCSGGRFCCLGVLCQLMRPDGWFNLTDMGYVLHDFQKNLPSDEILAEAGLNSAQAIRLANKNDGGARFPELADYIESNL